MKALLSLLLSLLLATPSLAGELAASQADWYEQYKSQPNAPLPEEMLLNTDPEPAWEGEGFQSLFNGKDLSGWVAYGGDGTFEATPEGILGTCVPDSPSTYLSTERADFQNFVFSCEVKWLVNGNTGIQFRSQTRQDKKGRQVVFGPQAEMEEAKERPRGWSGGIFGQSCGGYLYPLWLQAHEEARGAIRRDEWNRITIQAQGQVMKTWVNGLPAAHWVDQEDRFPRGFFSLQVHSGAQGTILFRDPRVKELP
ncbi:MAG: DUF1080 domain-containing protein [Verrucomicrobiota bacterium]